MADETKQKHVPDTVLIAQLRVHLVNGEAFDLLPIRHQRDVKTEVEALIKNWSDSGFLLRGRHIYPWHQIRQIEVTSIEEMPADVAHQQYSDVLAAERAHRREDFWRTRPDQEKA